LDEFAGQFDQLGLKEVECVEGFDPNDLFTTHMSLVGYSSYFTKSEQFKEGGGDNQNLPETSVDEALNDIEELASTNECYRTKGQRSNKQKPQFSQVFHKEVPRTKTKPRSSGLETRKTPVETQMMAVTKTL
jgi:hypothetical protein